MRLRTEESPSHSNNDAYFSSSNRMLTDMNRKGRSMQKSNSKIFKKSSERRGINFSPAKTFFNTNSLKHYTPLGLF